MIKLLLDFYKESQEAAKERLKLPIIPFYITLVLLSYWMPISLYLFSESSIEGKIKQISELYADWNIWNHLWNLLLLIVISFLSSIIFPLIMWAIEYILRGPNNERKKLYNTSKDLDMKFELQSTQHKFNKEKILSGKKEVEEYNESIEALKKSYDERIRNVETMNQQKEKNFILELESVKNANEVLSSKYKKSQNEIVKMQNNFSYINSNDDLKIYQINYDELFNILSKIIDVNSEIIFSNKYLLDLNQETKKLLLAFVRSRKGKLFRKMLNLIKVDKGMLEIDLNREEDLNDRNFILENQIAVCTRRYEKTEFYDININSANIIIIIELKCNQLVKNPQIFEYLSDENLRSTLDYNGQL